jgi:GrpB-like predicted nucleotidyltransferase (UPF0157 family)
VDAEEFWVEVRAYDEGWVTTYETEAEAIRSVLGAYALGVEHFGSTAVPGLLSKPIVDILIGSDDGSDPRVATTGLARLGYEYLGEDGRRPGRYFWRKRGADAFNVSLVLFLGEMWQSNLAVRDFLRSHPKWADRYALVKVQAASQSQTSMLAYQNLKRDFVDELRAAAQSWAAVNRA